MIKETVDAVRVAELEADKTINTAKENAQDKKNQLKKKSESYKLDALNEAKVIASRQMEETVTKCREFTEKAEEETKAKIAELSNIASKNEEEAVNAVINALV